MTERPYVPPRQALLEATPTAGARFSSLSTRITFWYGMILGLCLVAYSLAVGLSFQRHVGTELDTRLHEDIELAARAIVMDDEGGLRWPGGTLGKYVDEEEGGGHWLESWSPSGERLLTSGTMEPLDLGAPPDGALDHEARTLSLPRGPVRVMTEALRYPGGHFLVRAAVSEAGVRAQVRVVWLELLAFSIGVLILGGLGGYALSRRSLAPLGRMADQARRITAEHLHERLPPQHTAELEPDLALGEFRQEVLRLAPRRHTLCIEGQVASGR